MQPFNSGTIHSNFQEARRSAGSLRNKTASLLRFSSFTTPTDQRSQKQRVDTTRPITGKFYHVTAQDVLNSGGYYVIGDVTSHTEVEIQGASNTSGAILQPDRLLFEGFLYQVQGKPKRVIVAGGRAFTETLWRKL